MSASEGGGKGLVPSFSVHKKRRFSYMVLAIEIGSAASHFDGERGAAPSVAGELLPVME